MYYSQYKICEKLILETEEIKITLKTETLIFSLYTL